MVSSQNLVAFFVASAIIIIVPGPSVLFTVVSTAALRGGELPRYSRP